MFNRSVQAGVTNTVVEWSGQDYINFTSASGGATYTRFGVDISGGISNISTGFFNDSQLIQCNDSDYITDELGNVYYLIMQYTTITTARPART